MLWSEKIFGMKTIVGLKKSKVRKKFWYENNCGSNGCFKSDMYNDYIFDKK